jgi:hypothetical protein
MTPANIRAPLQHVQQFFPPPGSGCCSTILRI